MRDPVAFIRNELTDFYPSQEIKIFIHLILKEVCNLSFIEIATCKINNLSDAQYKKIQDIVERLKKYEPFQYIIGKTVFFGMEFNINASVLIPRPETEELVEWILSENGLQHTRILDIGTGSGCIAIALARKISDAEVHAWDVSSKALEVAKCNARKNRVEIVFRQLDVLKETVADIMFDIIVSNPPYVTEAEKSEMEQNVLDFEPSEALFVPDTDPLLFYRRISDIASQQLKEGGKLYVEINRLFGRKIVEMLEKKGFSSVEVRKDISGNDRMIRAKK